MTLKTTDLKRGLDVFASDGHKVGSVVEIYGSEFGDEPGLAPPTGNLPTGEPSPFIKVRKSILGAARADLHVPANAVRAVSEKGVELNAPSDECLKRYSNR
ncbi:MAG: hypothetical protein DLM70_01005 [Chloroflexi bacterium]|nr:MAG: hypothetical protein DLM70_01005 [Chloroflexota bacterium]